MFCSQRRTQRRTQIIRTQISDPIFLRKEITILRRKFVWEGEPKFVFLGLQRFIACQPLRFADPERLAQPPTVLIADADVADFALTDQVVEGPQTLFGGRLEVHVVNLVEVDVVGLEPL